MSKKSLDLASGEKLWRRLCSKSGLPFSFSYGDKCYRGLSGTRNCSFTETKSETGRCGEFVATIESNLRITVKTVYCAEFGQSEYTVWFENTGKKASKPLHDVAVLDIEFPGSEPVLRGCLGDIPSHYASYENHLLNGDAYYRSDWGRATHCAFPYFDLALGKGGMLLSLGWAGTWDATFRAAEGKARVKGRTNLDFDSILLPGEKVRTALVVLMPYRGKSADNATNLWREWFMKYNLPRDREGKMLQPFSTAFFAYDSGLPNSDGSISERSYTWKPTLDRLVKEKMLTDFRWFDAGWYYDPAGKTVESDWFGSVGTWEIDRDKWPGDTLRESNEACHALGMKVLMWFEPERVSKVDDLCKYHGYKKEWSIPQDQLSIGRVITNNIGDPECRQWTLKRILKAMDESGVDMYREDNNSNPAVAWAVLDQEEEKKYGKKRRGISENKGVCGHYALWDAIIEYCRAHGKCTYVDSCASGGGRNDLESMRRGFPLMRSDADRQKSGMRLSQTTTLCRWLPFHGSCVKDSESALTPTSGRGADRYVARASYLPIYNLQEAFSRNRELDYDLMRGNFNEWKSIRHLLTKDFYALTPWRFHNDLEWWTAFAYEDSDTGESIALIFRQEEAEANRFRLKLPYAEKGRKYRLTDADSQETFEKTGEELLAGITVSIENKRESRLLRIQRLE